MAVSEWVVEIHVAWWFRYLYMPGLNFMLALCFFLGCWWVRVDEEKLGRVLRKAVTVSTVKAKKNA